MTGVQIRWKNTRENYSVNTMMHTKFTKLEKTENTTTVDIHIAPQKAGDKTRRDIKIVDRPRTVPRS